MSIQQYLYGLIPSLDEGLLEPETISRKAYDRDEIAEAWDDLDGESQELVRRADRELVQNAGLVAPYWRQDEVAWMRRKEQPPLSRWWWWLDKIADGSYPEELLPEWVK